MTGDWRRWPRRQSPVIEDQEVDARQMFEEPSMPIVAARLVAQRAGDPTFAGSGRAADQQILPAGNPFTGDKLGEQPLVEAARSFRVDVLDDGVLSEACELQSTGRHS